MRLRGLFYLFLLGLFVGCEQPYVGIQAEEEVEEDSNPNVFLSVKPLPCERINLSFYRGETKVKTVNMTDTVPVSGQFALSLSSGTYHVVAVAHNSTDNAIFSSGLDKITFKSNLISETYLCSEQIEVDSTLCHRTLTFDKVTAKIQFSYLDSLPQGAAVIKFYYYGGSSTLSAVSGLGCVNSRQTVKLSPSSSQVYTLYTFPHTEKDVVKLTVSVLAADDSVLQEVVIENLSIQKSCLSRVKYRNGKVFRELPVEETFNDWGTEYEYPF